MHVTATIFVSERLKNMVEAANDSTILVRSSIFLLSMCTSARCVRRRPIEIRVIDQGHRTTRPSNNNRRKELEPVSARYVRIGFSGTLRIFQGESVRPFLMSVRFKRFAMCVLQIERRHRCVDDPR